MVLHGYSINRLSGTTQSFNDCFDCHAPPGYRNLYGASRVHNNRTMTAVMYNAIIANGHLMAILWLLMGLSQPFDDCFSCNTPPTDKADSLYGQYGQSVGKIWCSMGIV